jgi:predicted enzyme related to lactoylglutathione lyase
MTDATPETTAATGIDFVMYLVKDMPRAQAFYESVFALRRGEFDSENFVEYDLPDGNTFALAVAPEGADVRCGGLMFAVADVEAAVARVKDAGGTFFANFGGEVCTSGWCADPDGNPFGVHRRFERRAGTSI